MLVHTSCSRRANWWEDCDAQQSSYISDQERTSGSCWGVSRWAAVELDGQLTICFGPSASQRQKVG